MARQSHFSVAILILVLTYLSSVRGENEYETSTIQVLVAKISMMEARIVKLEKSEASLKQSIGALIGTTAQFRLQIEDLTRKLESTEKSDRDKEERIKILENIQAKCREEFYNAKSDEAVEVTDIRNHEVTEKNGIVLEETTGKSVKRGIRQTSDNLAFTAYLDHVERNLGKDQPVVYNQVLLNDGSAYSEKTGIFRAPVSGVYLLSWSVTARKLPGEHSYDVWVKLVVNGAHQTGAVAESRADTDDNQGSNSAVLRLSQGDEVHKIFIPCFTGKVNTSILTAHRRTCEDQAHMSFNTKSGQDVESERPTFEENGYTLYSIHLIRGEEGLDGVPLNKARCHDLECIKVLF